MDVFASEKIMDQKKTFNFCLPSLAEEHVYLSSLLSIEFPCLTSSYLHLKDHTWLPLFMFG